MNRTRCLMVVLAGAVALLSNATTAQAGVTGQIEDAKAILTRLDRTVYSPEVRGLESATFTMTTTDLTGADVDIAGKWSPKRPHEEVILEYPGTFPQMLQSLAGMVATYAIHPAWANMVNAKALKERNGKVSAVREDHPHGKMYMAKFEYDELKDVPGAISQSRIWVDEGTSVATALEITKNGQALTLTYIWAKDSKGNTVLHKVEFDVGGQKATIEYRMGGMGDFRVVTSATVSGLMTPLKYTFKDWKLSGTAKAAPRAEAFPTIDGTAPSGGGDEMVIDGGEAGDGGANNAVNEEAWKQIDAISAKYWSLSTDDEIKRITGTATLAKVGKWTPKCDIAYQGGSRSINPPDAPKGMTDVEAAQAAMPGMVVIEQYGWGVDLRQQFRAHAVEVKDADLRNQKFVVAFTPPKTSVDWPYTRTDVTFKNQLVESMEVFTADGESYTVTWDTKETSDGLLYVTGGDIDGTIDGKKQKGSISVKHKTSRGTPLYVTSIIVKVGRSSDKYSLSGWKFEKD